MALQVAGGDSLEPLDRLRALVARAVVRPEETDEQRQRRTEPLDESPSPLLGAAAVPAFDEAHPRCKRLVVPAHDLDQLVVDDEALEEEGGVRPMVTRAADPSGALWRPVLERVVDECRES